MKDIKQAFTKNAEEFDEAIDEVRAQGIAL